MCIEITYTDTKDDNNSTESIAALLQANACRIAKYSILLLVNYLKMLGILECNALPQLVRCLNFWSIHIMGPAMNGFCTRSAIVAFLSRWPNTPP
eukprot:scaffold190143_cov15-Prasinocladus_malaysianus.AAC.1